ncbi:MAG: beta-glucosidase BglX [Bacteroidetes bacterium]|nr:MAG: beta-glucosidase BglX [Bacteroidota bacterium]
MKVRALLSCLFWAMLQAKAQKLTPTQRANALLQRMTLAEKIGQLNQLSADFATGPITPQGNKQQLARSGQLGSMLNLMGASRTRQLQELAMQSRLKIPLLFGQDVIHGYRTTFPIPLAEAASWDLPAMQQTARIAATEASAAGIHWIFAPMVDISRDPRWGRVMEGAGEDPYLGSLIAAARVKGFQGSGLGHTNAVMACVKHFAAYGAAIGGRDYNGADVSQRSLWETYLPPFKAAVDAGAATVMNGFNDINGIPATANALLQNNILKGQWKFSGFVVSDWASISELIVHGYAKDHKQAAQQAILAGNDMDMESSAYQNHLATLVKQGQVPMATVNNAVRRILIKKFEMGLFDDPYKFCNPQNEEAQYDNAAHQQFARTMAAKSIVMLKNDTLQSQPLLPLKKTQKIALIGPLVTSQRDNLGFWSFNFDDDSTRLVSLYQGMQNALGSNAPLLYAKGCNLNDADTSGFAQAIATALLADVVVMQVGEARDMSGEAKSKSNLQLPGVQEALIKAIHRTGKPMVVLISAGRPLIFNWTAKHIPAILYTWWLGMQAGNAMADVLFGQHNPSARLPITFPRAEGQIPIYYSHHNTGRPAANDSDLNYVSAYIDLPNSPQYAFGYGLGYGTVTYAKPVVSNTTPKGNNTVDVSVSIAYNGPSPRTETVQLYIHDKTASVVRPVKELRKFQQLTLLPNQQRVVTFKLTTEDLKFYNHKLQYVWEPGAFNIMVGPSSDKVQTVTVNWGK